MLTYFRGFLGYLQSYLFGDKYTNNKSIYTRGISVRDTWIKSTYIQNIYNKDAYIGGIYNRRKWYIYKDSFNQIKYNNFTVNY